MNKERADELVAALRSGKYRQGRDFLYLEKKYCCLGVACRISNLGKFVNDVGIEDFCTHGKEYLCGKSDHSDTVLPDMVQEYFGFHDDTGTRKDGKRIEISGEFFTSLVAANDDGKSFKEIAAYIEQNWEDL